MSAAPAAATGPNSSSTSGRARYGQGRARPSGGARACAQLRWLSGQAAERFAAPYAPAYNHLGEAPALCLTAPAAGVTALLWLLSLGGACGAALLPVSDAAGRPLAPEAAGAVRIRQAGRDYTVLFSWQAGAHEAGLLCAGGCTAHGQVTVFTPQHPEGSCLD